MAEMKSYAGGCHCGHVSYDVTTDLATVVACNCSICSKLGSLWTFVPPQQFSLRAGADDLRDYQFNKHVIHHLFCPTCGIESFARGAAPSGAEMIAVNVRCLEGVDIDALKTARFDGRSL